MDGVGVGRGRRGGVSSCRGPTDAGGPRASPRPGASAPVAPSVAAFLLANDRLTVFSAP